MRLAMSTRIPSGGSSNIFKTVGILTMIRRKQLEHYRNREKRNKPRKPRKRRKRANPPRMKRRRKKTMMMTMTTEMMTKDIRIPLIPTRRVIISIKFGQLGFHRGDRVRTPAYTKEP